MKPFPEQLSLTGLWHCKSHYVNMIDRGHIEIMARSTHKLIQRASTFLWRDEGDDAGSLQTLEGPLFTVSGRLRGFHSIILKDSCLPQHKYVPLTPIGVTAINAPRRTGCHIRCRGKSTLKWMKCSSSRRLNRSRRRLKDNEDGSNYKGRLKCSPCLVVCGGDWIPHRRHITAWHTLTKHTHTPSHSDTSSIRHQHTEQQVHRSV